MSLRISALFKSDPLGRKKAAFPAGKTAGARLVHRFVALSLLRGLRFWASLIFVKNVVPLSFDLAFEAGTLRCGLTESLG